MKLAIDITGSWITITAVRPTRDRKSRPAAVISMLSTALAEAAPADILAMNSEECRAVMKPMLSLSSLSNTLR